MNNESSQNNVEEPTIQQSANEIGLVGRIFGVFTSPRKTFENISLKPTWLVPLLILVILTGV